ncbi:MAG: MBL fold metallo-hydrolase [Pseudomonadota bacterium]
MDTSAPRPTPIKLAIQPVTPLQQNCSLVWCEKTKKGAFVDPGGDLDVLASLPEKYGITIEKLLVTHGHIDHCGRTKEFAEKLGVPIEGPHRDDKFWIDRLPEDGARYGLTGARSFEPDRWLEDGDTVTVGEAVFDVYHCPGHTPGHVIFYHHDVKLAIVGDVLFKGSIGRTDFPRGNHGDLLNAIQTKLWPLGNNVAFVPGHGPMSTFGEERQTNAYVSDKALGAT